MSKTNPAQELVELKSFGTNPGSLKGWLYLPSILAPNSPLVVALHGCTQAAAGYDEGTGWSQLAKEKGFAVLLPEQQKSNNSNLCFNWFEPADTRRDMGETASIWQMVDHVVQSHGLNPDRIYITGLSAGGAMANVLLANHPEHFAGGAIIGGLPYGVSAGVAQAFERMHGRNPPSSRTLRQALKAASTHTARLPSISIWHGTHDHTVKLINAQQIADQWRGMHDLSGEAKEETVNGHSRKTWSDCKGHPQLELYLTKGMGHGVPLASDNQLGRTGAYMLNSGISSTARIARSWGLVDDEDVASFETLSADNRAMAEEGDGVQSIVARALEFATKARPGGHKPSDDPAEQGVGKVINDALRRAGLLK